MEEERSNQACGHNEQDELKGEQRAMRGIQNCSHTGRRVVCVCVSKGGWRASPRLGGGARESTGGSRRERETAILISLLYKLPSPSHFTLLSSLQSPQ